MLKKTSSETTEEILAQRLARTADVAGSLSPTQHPAPSSHSLVNKSGLQKCPLIPIHRGVVAEQPSEMRAVPSAIIVKTESYEVLSSELTVPLSHTRHVCSSTLGLTKDHKHTSCVRSYFHGHVCLVSVRVRGALRASPDLLRPVDLIEADVFCSQKAPYVVRNEKESKKDKSIEQNQKRQELITKSAAAEAKLALKGSVECITVDEIKAMLKECASSNIVPFGNWHKPLASRTPPQLTTSLYKQ